MDAIINFLQKNADTIGVVMMPFTYGFVGWFTNWVALKMTFYPLNFVGIPPYLGWQGIIPRKAYKMASKSVDIITTRLIKVDEVFSRIQPDQVAKELRPLLNEISNDLVKDVVDDINPNLWKFLPDAVKNEMLLQVQGNNKETIKLITDQMRSNIYEIFDIKALVLKSLTGPNVHLVVEMFQKVGGPEFRFIEVSGLYFGFLLGLIQMVIWYFFPIWWTLPIQGIIVGYITNWLAIYMIFSPQQEVKIGPFKYQGLFHKRQNEVSDQYAHLVATKILTPKKVMGEIFYGRAAEQVLTYIRRALLQAVDKSVNIAKPVLFLTIGNEKYEELKKFIISKMMRMIPRTTEKIEGYLEKALDFENTMASKMKTLSPQEFEEILRTAFQEDEFILILVGAILGGIVGLGQALYMISV